MLVTQDDVHGRPPPPQGGRRRGRQSPPSQAWRRRRRRRRTSRTSRTPPEQGALARQARRVRVVLRQVRDGTGVVMYGTPELVDS